MERSSSRNELKQDPKYHGIRKLRPARAISKTGVHNVALKNIPNKALHFWKDIVTTLVDVQWRYTFGVFTMSYFVTWFIFAGIFYWMAYIHGDFNFDPVTGARLGKGDYPCIFHAEGFSGFLLMSVESQTSIGYGDKYPSEECKDAIALMAIQIIIGVCIEGAMIGVVWAKMSRPTKRTLEQKFSRKAVICLREGKLCLVFRVDDPGRNHDIGTKVEAFWLGEKISAEGEFIGKFQKSLALECNGQVTLLWPQTVAHIIDETSPLYDMAAQDLLEIKFEIILTITGNSSLFPQISQSRTSYLSREIKWGHRFKNIIQLNEKNGTYIADYENFDKTEVVSTALCSAKRLDEIMRHYNRSTQLEDPEDYTEKNISDYGINKIVAGLEHIDVNTVVLECSS